MGPPGVVCWRGRPSHGRGRRDRARAPEGPSACARRVDAGQSRTGRAAASDSTCSSWSTVTRRTSAVRRPTAKRTFWTRPRRGGERVVLRAEGQRPRPGWRRRPAGRGRGSTRSRASAGPARTSRGSTAGGGSRRRRSATARPARARRTTRATAVQPRVRGPWGWRRGRPTAPRRLAPLLLLDVVDVDDEDEVGVPALPRSRRPRSSSRWFSPSSRKADMPSARVTRRAPPGASKRLESWASVDPCQRSRTISSPTTSSPSRRETWGRSAAARASSAAARRRGRARRAAPPRPADIRRSRAQHGGRTPPPAASPSHGRECVSPPDAARARGARGSPPRAGARAGGALAAARAAPSRWWHRRRAGSARGSARPTAGGPAGAARGR